MGLLSFLFEPSSGKNNTGMDRGLEKFLNQVDTLYMEAYERKTIKQIAPFVTREFAIKLNRVVYQLNTRYFGVDKFRKTGWNVLDQSDLTIVVEKKVKFDKVRVGGRLKIDVATDYVEKWVISKSGGKWLVDNVILLS